LLAATEDGRHHQLLDVMLRGAGRFLDENRESRRARFEEETPWWVPTAIDRRIFDRPPPRRWSHRSRIRTRTTSLALRSRPMNEAGDETRGRLDSWPSGRLGWVFASVSRFEGAATTFLAQGAARGERQMFLADNPLVEQWPKHLVDRGELLIASITEIYGSDRMVEPASKRETFAAALADASLRATRGYGWRRTTAASSMLQSACRRGWGGKKSLIDSWRRIRSLGFVRSIGRGWGRPASPQ
jgi:hypothetical protein